LQTSYQQSYPQTVDNLFLYSVKLRNTPYNEGKNPHDLGC